LPACPVRFDHGASVHRKRESQHQLSIRLTVATLST